MPSYFPENNVPDVGDSDSRLLQKIAGSLSAGLATTAPVGGSTSALQTSGNSSLSSIDSKLPALVGGYLPTTSVSSDTTVSGNITALNTVPNGVASANSSVQIPTEGAYTVTVQVKGTYVGTLSLQESIDAGVSWVAILGVPVPSGAVVSTLTSAAVGTWTAITGGFKLFRIMATAFTSGTAVIILNASIAQNQMGAHVYGSSAVGSAPGYAPVSVSGTDAGGLKRGFLLDTDGTTNSNLTKVGNSTFALGQQLAAASLPVVIPAAQLATLTPLSTVSSNLLAGTAVVGKFTTDQTTHGTTDLVAGDVTKVGGVAVPSVAGTFRVPVVLAAGATVGGAVSTITDVAGGVDGGGLARQFLTDTTGTQAVNIAKVGGTAVSLGQKTSATSIPVVVSSDFTPTDESGMNLAILKALTILVNPISLDAASGRLRVMLDPAGGGQTLGTVSTVSTVTSVTNQAQIGGTPANSFIFDVMYDGWCNATRGRIS